MHAIVDFCLVPFTTEGSIAPLVAICQRVLEDAGLTHELHGNGTGVEGELSAIFAAIEACHEAIHSEGAGRIFTTIRVGTRVDKQDSMADKIARAKAHL